MSITVCSQQPLPDHAEFSPSGKLERLKTCRNPPPKPTMSSFFWIPFSKNSIPESMAQPIWFSLVFQVPAVAGAEFQSHLSYFSIEKISKTRLDCQIFEP